MIIILWPGIIRTKLVITFTKVSGLIFNLFMFFPELANPEQQIVNSIFWMAACLDGFAIQSKQMLHSSKQCKHFF